MPLVTHKRIRHFFMLLLLIFTFMVSGRGNPRSKNEKVATCPTSAEQCVHSYAKKCEAMHVPKLTCSLSFPVQFVRLHLPMAARA